MLRYSAQGVIVLIPLFALGGRGLLVLLTKRSLSLPPQGIIDEVTEDGETGHLCPGGRRGDDLGSVAWVHEGLSLGVEGCRIGLLLAILVEEGVWLELPPDDKHHETCQEENMHEE